MKHWFTVLALGLSALNAPKTAQASDLPEERFKAAVNQVVQKVRRADNPAEKREILTGFLARMENALAKVGELSSLPEGDRAALAGLTNRFGTYRNELEGKAGYAGVPDTELDRFAGYLQQDMEQAPVGGGIYISGGALLVALLLIILLL